MKEIDKLTNIPNANYEKFFKKMQEFISTETKEWNKNHILGYFCKKYQDYYGTKYQFKFNTPAPSKCFELFQIGALAGKLSSDPLTLKHYIDWTFDEVVPKAKGKLTSVSFLNKEEPLKFYKLHVHNHLKDTTSQLNRATLLPNEYLEIFKQNNSSIKTYGELAFIYNMSDLPDNIKLACEQIEKMGFDKSVLERAI